MYRPVLSGPLTPAHRDRLLGAGVEPDILAALTEGRSILRRVEGPLPTWWPGSGNAIYLLDGVRLPERLVELLTTYPFRDTVVVVASDLTHLTCLLVGGDGATVFVGERAFLSDGEIYCGAGSSVVLNGRVVATSRAQLDARNGGSLVAAPDQLWASGVYLATDDMHRLEDLATGARLNPYGATIRLGEHVWLGRDAIVTGHVEIGEGSVVGARSLVRGQKIASHVVVAGTPARVIREGVTWRGEDTP